MVLCFFYRVFIKDCIFPQNVMIFLNSASSDAAALVFYLPSGDPSMQLERENRERPESGIYFKILIY